MFFCPTYGFICDDCNNYVYMYLVSYGEGFVWEWQQLGQMCKHAFEIIKIIQVIPKKKPHVPILWIIYFNLVCGIRVFFEYFLQRILINIKMHAKVCHNHRVLFTYQKNISDMECCWRKHIWHKVAWTHGQFAINHCGQSAETTWSIGRNHDVFKLLALSPIALGFFASGLV